jgi:hypothetical protein
VVTALRYGLQVTRHERAEVMARKRQEGGCFVLLTNVPTVGEMAHSARAVLQAYKEPHGIAQNDGFLKAPLLVHSLFLKKPERLAARGLLLLLALLVGRLVERTLRVHVETTGNPFTGGDKKTTQKPTAFMMMTKFAAVLVLTVGSQRQRAQPLSPIPQQYLVALGIPATYCTVPRSGAGDDEASPCAQRARPARGGRDRLQGSGEGQRARPRAAALWLDQVALADPPRKTLIDPR